MKNASKYNSEFIHEVFNVYAKIINRFAKWKEIVTEINRQ